MLALAQPSIPNSINFVRSKIVEESFQERKHNHQKEIDQIMDYILDFKSMLNEKTNRINNLIISLEALTWHGKPTDDDLLGIHEIIVLGRDFCNSLTKYYVLVNNNFKSRKIATAQIKEYKEALDDLKEVINDLESTFFILPEISEFQKSTIRLNSF